MQRTPLRRLVAGPRPGPERIFFYSIWFRGHNNPRYAELLPRLERLDAYLLLVPDRKALRALTYRAAQTFRRAGDAAVLRRASVRYRSLLTADPGQIGRFDGPTVADVDDPAFSNREVELLSHPRLAAYVVTHERAARRFETLGVQRPWYVVPQGAGLSSVTPEEIAAARTRRGATPLVVGYLAAWLLTGTDRGGGNPLYNVEHLLELWDEIHARVPEAVLWLIGGASAQVRARVHGREDIVLFGRLPREKALAHVAAFDIGLYPRAADQGIQSAKIAEYLGFGVPTVSYDYEVTQELRETGAGILAQTPREFVAAVQRLARDEPERRRIAALARTAGRERDWDALAACYAEILDEHLPR